MIAAAIFASFAISVQCFGMIPNIRFQSEKLVPAFVKAVCNHFVFVFEASTNRPNSALGLLPNLPKVSFSGKSPAGPSGPTLPAEGEDLSFLEANPYWDQTNLPLNLAKQKNPFVGKIVSTQSIVGPNAPGDICNVVIDHRG
jgi:hypothetical protein